MTTHFSSGVTNVSGNSVLTALRTMAPNVYYGPNWDFFEYVSANWTKTDTGTGTIAVVDGAGGWLQLSNAAAGATDALQIQYNGASSGARIQVTWDPTKDFIMNARVQGDTTSNVAWLVGLATVDTSLIASLPTDGLYFYKASGAASLIASTRKSGTSSSVTLGNVAAATFNDMSLIYTAVDGIWRATLDGTVMGTITSTTNTPTNSLAISLAVTNATAAAHSMTIDWFNVMVQR